ncbi:MAG TPA: hypothetical protein ENK13_04305, partial [Thermopetrobacter sp.]|nr:hypothetical protein [Thermopetrobacter sp.]
MGNEPLWREGGAILPGARALDADKAWSGAPAANGGAIPRIGALRTALRRLAALRIGPAPAAGDIVALAA